MQNKNLMYEGALDELRALAHEAELESEIQKAIELESAAAVLAGWLADGKPGPCPVNLGAFGMNAEDELAESTLIVPAQIVKVRKEASEPFKQPSATEPTKEAKPSMRKSAKDKGGARGSLEVQEEMPSNIGEKTAKGSVEIEEEIPSIIMVETAKEGLPSIELVDDDLDIPVAEIETPEQAELKRQLGVVRQHMEAGELREAAALSRNLVERAGDVKDLQDIGRDLYDEAQRRLNNKLKKVLSLGDQARKDGKEEEARKQFQAALEMDPDNDHARRAKLELDHALAASVSETELTKLRAGLRERQNIDILGKAVYLAKALDAEEKLPTSFESLLNAARDAYDAQRQAHGEETTMMRFGDLEARKKARDKIAEDVAKGHEFIFDATLNMNRVASEVLNEADKLYLQRSEDTAQYELPRVDFLLPGYPQAARKHLLEALEKPLYEQHKDILRNKLAEIEKLLQGQEAAEALLKQAHQESDALKILDLVSQARAVFKDLPGINKRVETVRRTACETMAAGMRRHYSQADMLVKTVGFSSGKRKYDVFAQVREEVHTADALLARWPEGEKPQELLDLAGTGEQILKRVGEEEALARKFEGKVDAILAQVGKPATLAAGMALFKELRGDPRFTQYPDMQELNGMMDQYRDIREQLEEANLARREREWQRAYKLAKEMFDSGKAGQAQAEVESLLKEAEVEIGIQEAQQALDKDYIQEANRILSKLLKSANTAAGNDLKKRLKSEYAKIDLAIEDNPPMQKLYDHARSIKENTGYDQKILALRMYRYVAGDPTEVPQPDWPEYRLSLRTADARREARELGDKLRTIWLPPLEEAFSKIEMNSPSSIEFITLAERARWLREANLIEHEDQRKAVRWAEMGWELHRVEEKERNGSWEEAEKILRDLDINYPRQSEIEGRLHKARVQRLIARTQNMIISGDVDGAVSLLTDGEVDEDLRNTLEVMLSLVEAHANQNDFVQAFHVLTQVGVRYPSAQKAIFQKETEIRARLAWQLNRPEAWNLEQADFGDNAWSINGPAEALEIIQKALVEGNYENADALVKLQKEYFDQSKEYLINQAGKKQNKATQTSKVDSVIALLDLLRLEEILGIPDDRRESTRRVKPLCDSFIEVARALSDSVDDFEDQLSAPLGQALNETEQLHSRMQALLKAATTFKVNLGQDIKERIQKHITQVEKMRENLLRAEKLISQTSKDDMWINALRKGDFDDLRQTENRLGKLELGFISEVKHFSNKLKEWIEIHDWLANTIAKVRKQFTDGNFDEVIQSLDETKNLPELRFDGRPWNTITSRSIQPGVFHEDKMAQIEYQSIREIMATRLSIQDIYGDQTLIGWETVEENAHTRLLETEAWEVWSREGQTVMDKLSWLGNQVNTLSLSTPLIIQMRDLKALKECAEEAIQILQTGPILTNDAKAIVSSKQAKSRNDEGKKKLQSSQETLSYANSKIGEIQTEIDGLGGFPTSQKFRDAEVQKDWARLQKLIQQAQRIGWIDPKDQKRIDIYQKILKKGLSQADSDNGDGLISKFRNVFRRG